MISFGTFLAEAGNLKVVCAWCQKTMRDGDANNVTHSICPDCTKKFEANESVLAERTMLFHKDIGIPTFLSVPQTGMSLKYGTHSVQALRDDGVTPPTKLPAYTLIETEWTDGKVSKWVVRFKYNDRDDLVLALQPDGFVRTAWVNKSNDTHRTLDRRKYAHPSYLRLPANKVN